AECDVPDPEALRAEPGEYRHPARGDQAYAVLSAVVQSAVGRLTPDRWLGAWRVLSLAAQAGGTDVAAAAARALARARTGELPLPTREIAAFFPILQAAALIPAAAH